MLAPGLGPVAGVGRWELETGETWLRSPVEGNLKSTLTSAHNVPLIVAQDYTEWAAPPGGWPFRAIRPLEHADCLLTAAVHFLEQAAQAAEQPTLARLLELHADDLATFRESRVTETLRFLRRQQG
jgi:hypothetical protein